MDIGLVYKGSVEKGPVETVAESLVENGYRWYRSAAIPAKRAWIIDSYAEFIIPASPSLHFLPAALARPSR